VDHETDLGPIIERARGFDPDAWEELYRRLYPALRAYAGRRLAPVACDDAVSEAFTRAMEAVDRFSWRAGGFEGWMFGILRNVVLESYRKHRPECLLPEGAAPEPAADEPEALERLVAGERAAAVREAFAALPADERELLELRVLGGLDAKAVGVIVGKRAGAVRMAQARALARLGDLLGERAS
jgi:RNA polymerase sigma-70 factor, ECF subfamily